MQQLMEMEAEQRAREEEEKRLKEEQEKKNKEIWAAFGAKLREKFVVHKKVLEEEKAKAEADKLSEFVDEMIDIENYRKNIVEAKLSGKPFFPQKKDILTGINLN